MPSSPYSAVGFSIAYFLKIFLTAAVIRLFPGLSKYLVFLPVAGLLTVLFFAGTTSESAFAEDHSAAGTWKLWRKTAQLSVSYRPAEIADLIEIKAQAKIKSTLSGFLLFILDTQNAPNWLDNVKLTRVIKQISPTENLFITTFKSFGPIQARDMVINSRFWQNDDLSVEIKNLDAGDVVPLQSKTVRMRIAEANWLVTPNKDQTISIVYTFIADAKGRVPLWLSKPMALKGIWNTMNNIRQQLPESEWQLHSIPFIKELQQ